MHNYEYVPQKVAEPLKKEIIELLHLVQDEVKPYFTFRFDPVGSSSRNMITWEPDRNIGFDFDYNIEPNVPNEKYKPYEIHNIIFEAIRKHMGKFGYSKIEASTSAITIKAIDRDNRRIEHSCDFAIVHHFNDGQQQYIKMDKFYRTTINWQLRDNDYYIDEKLKWIKKHGLKPKLREIYLDYKNRNNNPQKKSRTIFAEAVNDLHNQYNG
ncbi:hypothetical protein [Ruminococcus flavefaciens]|uniref:hypothetical protein n=1 Tax=Ruminococcus flavefaciens TaxID=1265 RepID=UPI00048DF033|nr:hypothetical protein [Ruminococcus flavefaciens]